MAERLTRTSYVEPNGRPRQDKTGNTESRVDLERYVQPLLRTHAAGLHRWGIAAGLAVHATVGAPGVRVSPGVALDFEGRHVTLAPGGKAKLDDQTTTPVDSTGVTLPTAGLSGVFLLTIAWAETFDRAALTASGIFQTDDTPLLLLRQGIDVDGDQEVVLAAVIIDAGNVSHLDPDLRRSARDLIALDRATLTTNGTDMTVSHETVAELHVTPQGFVKLSARLDVDALSVLELNGAGEFGECVLHGQLFTESISIGGEGSAGGNCLFVHDRIGIGIHPFEMDTSLAVHKDFFTDSAATFVGDVTVTGTLTKGHVQFRIDHPLDPANRYLCHSGVESDEMKNVYDGEVVLDAHGEAVVTVTDWFEALNERIRYQLTPIGTAAPNLHVSRELSDNSFAIAGGEPSTKVCWLITGVRHDAYAVAHPVVVDAEKPDKERGTFLHPEAHGQPAERGFGHHTRQEPVNGDG
ncbi:hypothetical protein [Actinocrispum sp. NPDC049592]|uniref:hypothetical protein n=1 Tax=Actinocrispum sp. NPDC049592 TaxID=3154835 RepID=UPI00342040DB